MFHTKLGFAAVLVMLLSIVAGTYVAWQHFVPVASATIGKHTISFRYVEVDSFRAGDLKMVGDLDGDGKLDLVLGGKPQEGLVWYHNPTWSQTYIAKPDNEFTTDGALGDMDGDGDLDIVAPDGDTGDNLRWFENPRPARPASDGNAWKLHVVGSTGLWTKDVELADFDGDGHLDIATRRDTAAYIFFQTAPDTWSKQTFPNVNLGSEGMASGDVDGDGHIDLVLRGTWVRNPGGLAARSLANWQEYPVGDVDKDFKALVADVNGDRVADLLFSSSENTADVVWFTPSNGDPTGTWERHVIVPNLEHAHTLQVADMDGDGDQDVVVAQMHTTATREVMVYFNLDGHATSWEKYVIANSGIHNGVVADIDGDGRPDLYGANWTGHPPVKLWLNQSHAWNYKQVTASNQRTFGLAFGDVNADGHLDIISGQYWYHTTDGKLLGDWVQMPLPEAMHGCLAIDVDGDSAADVIAQKDEGDIGLYWLELQTNGTWFSHKLGSVPRASHELGAQGYKAGQIVAGGKTEVAFSSGQGIYYFSIPDHPDSEEWPRTQVNANPSDEGFSLGDIDRDGQIDIAATTGDSKRIEWYRNPGDGSADWQAFHIGDFGEALYPDRTELADLNGDTALDIIVTEENGEADGAETYWWQQPEDPTRANWERHLIVSQGSTNSMDVADIDGDSDTDIILAEHKGKLKIAAWLNDGTGTFTEDVIDTGKESHLGARTIDLDRDGDLDIVSIAYDDYGKIHLWCNERPAFSTGPPAPDPTPGTPPRVGEQDWKMYLVMVLRPRAVETADSCPGS